MSEELSLLVRVLIEGLLDSRTENVIAESMQASVALALAVDRKHVQVVVQTAARNQTTASSNEALSRKLAAVLWLRITMSAAKGGSMAFLTSNSGHRYLEEIMLHEMISRSLQLSHITFDVLMRASVAGIASNASTQVLPASNEGSGVSLIVLAPLCISIGGFLVFLIWWWCKTPTGKAASCITSKPTVSTTCVSSLDEVAEDPSNRISWPPTRWAWMPDSVDVCIETPPNSLRAAGLDQPGSPVRPPPCSPPSIRKFYSVEDDFSPGAPNRSKAQ